MTDDSENLMRFRASSWVLPPDLRSWVLEKLDATVSRQERRRARDGLLRQAAEAVGGTRYRQILEVERIQLWILRRPQSLTVVAGTPEEFVGMALANFPHPVRRRALRRIISG